jgi:HAD superfamily hydrolase (TIGR01549 family)
VNVETLTGIEAIFFDIDGTLSDSDDQIIAEIIERIRFLRKVWKEDSLRKFARNSVSVAMRFFNTSYHIVDRLGIDNFIARTFPKREGREGDEDERDHLLIEGVEALLNDLDGRFKLGIVSARNEHGVRAFLDKFDLVHHFQTIVGAQTCYYTKPFPHPLLHAANMVNVQPERCVMVGDTIVDILAGKAAGMRTVGVLCGFGTRQELMKAGADHVLSSPVDILRLLSD